MAEEEETIAILMAASASRDRLIYRTLFYGTNIYTTVTSAPNVVRRWLRSAVSHIRNGFYSKIIGLGVQWDSFTDSDSVATIQFCVRGRCLIVKLRQAPSVPRALRRFLNNPNYTFVGIWNQFDERQLLDCRFRLRMRNSPVEVRHHARTPQGLYLGDSPIENIVTECFGYRGSALRFMILFSIWESPTLTPHQVEHATIDPYAAYLLGNRALIRPSTAANLMAYLYDC